MAGCTRNASWCWWLAWCGLLAAPGSKGSASRNAFVSFATGYPANSLLAAIRPFLHFTEDTDDIVLFVNSRDVEGHTAELRGTVSRRSGSIVLVSADKYLDHFDDSRLFPNGKFARMQGRGGYMYAWHKRNFAIRNWMASDQSLKDTYKTVLLCDMRDIMFQGNIFTQPQLQGKPLGTLFVFSETQLYKDDFGAPKGWGHHDWHLNQKWVELCYGEAFLKKIWEDFSTCAGAVMGDYAAIASYLDVFTQEFVRVGVCAKEGSDTSVHVKLVTDLIASSGGNVEVINYLHAPLLHRGPLPAMGWTYDDNGRFVNEDGRLYAIVHQIDREPKYFTQYLKAWGCTQKGKTMECDATLPYDKPALQRFTAPPPPWKPGVKPPAKRADTVVKHTDAKPALVNAAPLANPTAAKRAEGTPSRPTLVTGGHVHTRELVQQLIRQRKHGDFNSSTFVQKVENLEEATMVSHEIHRGGGTSTPPQGVPTFETLKWYIPPWYRNKSHCEFPNIPNSTKITLPEGSPLTPVRDWLWRHSEYVGLAFLAQWLNCRVVTVDNPADADICFPNCWHGAHLEKVMLKGRWKNQQMIFRVNKDKMYNFMGCRMISFNMETKRPWNTRCDIASPYFHGIYAPAPTWEVAPWTLNLKRTNLLGFFGSTQRGRRAYIMTGFSQYATEHAAEATSRGYTQLFRAPFQELNMQNNSINKLDKKTKNTALLGQVCACLPWCSCSESSTSQQSLRVRARARARAHTL